MSHGSRSSRRERRSRSIPWTARRCSPVRTASRRARCASTPRRTAAARGQRREHTRPRPSRWRAAPPTRASRSTRRDASTTVRAGHAVPRRRAPVRLRRRADGPGGDVVETHPRRPTRDREARRQACHRGRQLAGEPASGTGVPRVDAYRPQCRVQHRPEPFRQRRADLVEAGQGSGGARADVRERRHRADGVCLRRVGRRRRVRDLDGPLDGRRRTLRDLRKVASFVAVTIPHCGSGIVIPAQPRTCANSNPIVSVDTSRGPYSGRVYVSYARTEFRGRQAAHIAVFDRRLRRIAPTPTRVRGGP